MSFGESWRACWGQRIQWGWVGGGYKGGSDDGAEIQETRPKGLASPKTLWGALKVLVVVSLEAGKDP